jgi:hypothetical protein
MAEKRGQDKAGGPWLIGVYVSANSSSVAIPPSNAHQPATARPYSGIVAAKSDADLARSSS